MALSSLLLQRRTETIGMTTCILNKQLSYQT